MLQLLQPIWLWASAGIIIPVLLHLWHTKQGKTQKVGSIVFMQESLKKQTASFKITEWLLLVLRCLVIVLLSLLLATPQWHRASQNSDKKGWIVVEKANFIETYQYFKPIIDSLLQKNYELHSFSATFETIKLKDSLQIQSDTINEATSNWQLAKLLDEKATSYLPVYLFTNNKLQNFTGNKQPNVRLVKWFTYSPVNTSEALLSNAYETAGDSIKIVTKHSNTTSTYFTSEIIALNKFYCKHNKATLDTSTLIVTIFTDKYLADANYVKAAVTTIQQFTKKKKLSVL